MPLQLAFPDSLLHAETDAERASLAADAGFMGIEYRADGLATRIEAINAALKDVPVQASSVVLDGDDDFLSTDEPTRQRALDAVRHAMTDAVDIGAEHVVIVPTRGPLQMPDLMPYKAPIELAVDLMVMHLRSLMDLAYVFGVTLHLRPINTYETGFLTSLRQGVELRRRIKFNQHVKLAADLYHMRLDTPDLAADLQAHADSVGLLYLSDDAGTLPGLGTTDFAAVQTSLADHTGWAVLRPTKDSPPYSRRQLKTAVSRLRMAGFLGL